LRRLHAINVNVVDLLTAYARFGNHVNMVDQSTADKTMAAIELFYFAYRAFTSHPDRVLAKRGLGRVHHRILYFVGRQPAIGVGALLAILQVSKQALNAPLRQLVGMKLIEVATPPHDRRVKQLSLTATGRQLERQLTATQVKHLAAAFTSAGTEAANGWQRVMQEIAD
jgi:DNA-binding MarR family transcriptional regulator